MRICEPEWLLTLTDVGDSWREIRERRKALHKGLQRRGCDLNLAWAVECAPHSAGHHIHGLGWGPPPSIQVVAEQASRVGMGEIADIRPVTGQRIVRYLMKQAIPVDGQLEHFLEMNGGQLIHTTRDFWRSGRSGSVFNGGVEEAVRRSRTR